MKQGLVSVEGIPLTQFCVSLKIADLKVLSISIDLFKVLSLFYHMSSLDVHTSSVKF